MYGNFCIFIFPFEAVAILLATACLILINADLTASLYKKVFHKVLFCNLPYIRHFALLLMVLNIS